MLHNIKYNYNNYLNKIRFLFKPKVFLRLYKMRKNGHFINFYDKFSDFAAKIEAVEQYRCLYCNEKNVGHLNAMYNQKNYNAIKEELKKEILEVINAY
jgi:hypothetical protein